MVVKHFHVVAMSQISGRGTFIDFSMLQNRLLVVEQVEFFENCANILVVNNFNIFVGLYENPCRDTFGGFL